MTSPRNGGVQTVAHDGRETAYRLTRPDRDGPVALYVHGSGATHRVWGHQYGPRGPIHPAVALDLSGRGASGDVSTPPGGETLGAYVADVRAVARETGADLLVGHSLGATVVLAALLEGEFEAAIVVGCGLFLEVPGRFRRWLGTDFDQAVTFLHDGRLFRDGDSRTVERSAAAMRSVGRAVTARDFLTCESLDPDRLGAIETPILAVVGAHDPLTPPDGHERLPALCGAELTVLPGAAHMAMVERPAAFADVVADFL